MISRKGFMRLAGLCGLGALLPKRQRLPDMLLGLPIKWTSLPSPEITLSPFPSGDVELAMAMRWQQWQNLDLICSRCGAVTKYLKATRPTVESSWENWYPDEPTFGKMLYECPDCGWQIEMPIMPSAIPMGEAENDDPKAREERAL